MPYYFEIILFNQQGFEVKRDRYEVGANEDESQAVAKALGQFSMRDDFALGDIIKIRGV